MSGAEWRFGQLRCSPSLLPLLLFSLLLLAAGPAAAEEEDRMMRAVPPARFCSMADAAYLAAVESAIATNRDADFAFGICMALAREADCQPPGWQKLLTLDKFFRHCIYPYTHTIPAFKDVPPCPEGFCMPSGGQPDYAQAVWRFLAAVWGMPPSKGTVSDFRAERARLEAERAAAAPRPGSGALADFPAGPTSFELALCGGGALLAGFLLGLPGHRRWRRRLQSGLVAALLTVAVYLGLVYLLPDTRLPDILLALSGALLFTSLRTVVRAVVLLRQRPPPATP